jgi:hypothetical protein
MKLIRKYRTWRKWGFQRKSALYLAIKYINL